MSLEEVNQLVQITAIILAGVWAVYTFIEQEKYKKGSVNIEFTMKKIGNIQDEVKKQLLSVIRVDISLHNPGQRRIALYPAPLLVHARKVQVLKEGDAWKNYELAIAEDNKIATRDFVLSQSEPVHLQLVFNDSFLEPNERISRRFDFFVSSAKYNFLEATIDVPYSFKSFGGINFKWREIDEKKYSFSFRGFHKVTSIELSDREQKKLGVIHALARTSSAIFDGLHKNT